MQKIPASKITAPQTALLQKADSNLQAKSPACRARLVGCRFLTTCSSSSRSSSLSRVSSRLPIRIPRPHDAAPAAQGGIRTNGGPKQRHESKNFSGLTYCPAVEPRIAQIQGLEFFCCLAQTARHQAFERSQKASCVTGQVAGCQGRKGTLKSLQLPI